ncbi:hypothetical protein FKW77_004966 [Venturia effusa]|uniref:Uncharacterized protein n=1 Tax=Venturia effusa TaxID=50376 RepID=A0A517LNY8_9PEZI|nr:hypothetical protein FKW77_004966 [Venturia effusa]
MSSRGITPPVGNDQNVFNPTGRLRKPPPVTPKRFSKFFTPRTSTGRVSKPTVTRAGRQLRDITDQSSLNSRVPHPRQFRTPSKKSVAFQDVNVKSKALQTPTSSSRKRKSYATPESSPPQQSSPCKRIRSDDVIPSSPPAYLDDLPVYERSMTPELREPPPRIRRAHGGSAASRMLERSFGGADYIARGRRRDNCIHWQAQTANFYTEPDDAHQFAHPALPFCTASCHTNSLVAIGDESGSIRLVETGRGSKDLFSETIVPFQPHTNAVMDLAFSSDDSMLATASGDQSSQIIDMKTQKIKYRMHEHTTSVKQVCFQPGNDNVIATSSRDGSVRIWDMRCKGAEVYVAETRRPSGFIPADELRTQYKAWDASTYNTIHGAHSDSHAIKGNSTFARDSGLKDTAPTQTSRAGAISVTSISFLSSPGRSHLLLTGSESSTTLKLWDIRNRYSRRNSPVALSTTQQPESHSRHRHFGITSLTQGGDGSRIYALSRDNTVYAYSTAHLVLGHAPELSSTFSAKHSRSVTDGRAGLGPIYGFRHPMLHVTSFYVKAAVRPAMGDKAEILAVGSSDGSPVLFPTDETLLCRSQVPQNEQPSSPRLFDINGNLSSSPIMSSSPVFGSRPRFTRSASSTSGISTRMLDTIPIHNNVGTPLLEGHKKEVTSVSWTYDGDLVTLGDDYVARCWREGPQAREMRTGGPGHARRAGWGWAGVQDGWDDDDDDEEED